MGCGVSRFEAPIRHVRINPHLHRRIEEIKRRRRTRSLKRITLSNKELLRRRSYEDVGEFITHFNPLFEEMQKNTHSREDNESYVTSKESKKLSEKVEPFEGNVRDEKVENVKDQNANAEHGEDEEEGTEDDNHDERRTGNKEGVFPGSPSFRIYYIENVDDEQNERDKEVKQIKESTYYVQNQSEVAVSLKDSATMPEKKGQKRRGFAKAIKGRKIRCY